MPSRLFGEYAAGRRGLAISASAAPEPEDEALRREAPDHAPRRAGCEVRLRTKVTKGAGSAAAALAMVFKLVESAQARWRAVNAPHLVALVRAGARFERGHLVERPEVHAA